MAQQLKSKEEAIKENLEFQGKTDNKWWLQASIKHYLETGNLSGSLLQAIHKTIDDHAKQTAIEFAEWIRREPDVYFGDDENNDTYSYMDKPITAEELFKLFQQSKK